MVYKVPCKHKKTRQEINDEGRLLKKKRKHKGLPSGNKQNDSEGKNGSRGASNLNDPRIGSKKPISLTAQQPQTTPRKVEKAQKVNLPPEKELAQLENDPKLEQLLDRIDEGETLTAAEQLFVDQSLERIEILMDMLGYEYDEGDDDEQDNGRDDIMKLLKQ
ncbi:Der GTPase-activating protein YihI [Utexia brackfieldae]|uniref:Der GTPase-activating protein YihI n=1 Tax=Utexia brackfieldae TaxID=3074108 RepID=UPI00370DE0CC